MTLQSELKEHIDVFVTLDRLSDTLAASAALIAESLSKGGKLLLCGNGGSAADSQHMAAELTGRYSLNRSPIAAIALSTDSSALTCISNDFGYQYIFERQIRAIGKKDDVLMLISTSGESENLILATKQAKLMGISTIGLLGKGGGSLKSQLDIPVVVESNSTARIQESHIFILHYLCGVIEERLMSIGCVKPE